MAAGGIALKFASDFEASTTKLVTLSGLSVGQMQQMKQAVLDLAPTVGIGPRALSDALLVVTSTGFQGAEAMEILSIAAKSSAIGMGDTKDIARALTAAISAYGSENLSAAAAGDILHATVVAGGAEATQLAGEIGRVVGVASQLGVSFQEVGAFIATYTRLGIDAAEATTGLSGVLNTILAPSAEAKTALDSIGLSADQLRQMVAEKGLGAALQELLTRLDGNTEAIGAMFGNVRALAGVLGTAGVQAAGYASNLQLITDSTGAVNAAFEQTKKTFAFQWDQFKAQAEKLAITLGTQLLPAMTGLLQAAKPLGDMLVTIVQWFGQLPQPVQTAALGILGLGAALGPVSYAIGTLIKVGSGIVSLVTTIFGAEAAGVALGGAWTTLISVFEVVAGIVAGLVTAFGGWAVLLAGAVVAGIVALGVKTGALQSIFSGLWSVLKGVVGTLGTMVEYVGLLGSSVFGSDQPAPKLPGSPSMFQGDTVGGLSGGAKNVDNFAIYSGMSPVSKPKITDEQKKAQKAAEDWQKSVDEMSGKGAITEAVAAMKRYAAAGSISADKTKALTKTLDDAFEAYVRLGNAALLAGNKMDRMSPDMLAKWAKGQEANTVAPLIASISQATLDQSALADKMKELAQSTVGRMGMANDDNTPHLMLPDMPGIVSEMSLATLTLNQDSIQKSKLAVTPFREAFGQLGKDLPGIVFGALQNGGNVGSAVAAAVGSQFSGQFQKAMEKAGGDLSKVSNGNKVLGIAGASIGAAFTGYSLGQQLGKGKGALAGAAAGAAAGSVVPGIGTAIGAGVGALAGWFGGKKKEKEAQKQLADAKAAWIEQYGGMEKLKAMADQLGISLGNAFTTKKPEEFGKAVDALNVALEAQKSKMEGIGMIVEGVNARGKVFADSIKTNSDGKATTAGDQGSFDRVGALALGAFGANVANGGGIMATLQQMKPTLDALNLAQSVYNFTASETTQKLLEINAAVNANLPAFSALDADGQILNGMLKANWADMGLFAAAASDVAAQITAITAGGMPMAQALALNQPVLQSLWEAQDKFKFATDDATQALIDQAVQQGIVGPQMKDVNKPILDVLLAIGKVLGADIPAALAGLPGAAASAAAGMNSAFGGVVPPKVYDGAIDGAPTGDSASGVWDSTGQAGNIVGVPQLARGGVVRSRAGGTLVNVGEGGRDEMVVPLSSGSSMGGSRTGSVIVIEMDGRSVAEFVVPHIPGVVQRYGLA